MVVPTKTKPPSIPVRKMPVNSYTGKNGDIPGPANYNPDDKATKIQQRVIDFSKREKKREIFSDPNLKNPGPGVYEHKNCMGEGDEKERTQTAKSSMFKSKVPNCKDTKDDNGIPGPGSYIDKKGKKSLHVRSHSYRVDPSGRGFMTSTKREGFWDNTLETPFTKGTNKMDGIDPGKYQNKKKKKSKNNLSGSGAMKQAFDSSEQRN